MKIKFLVIFIFALILPSNIFASDPTPLFVLFIEIPIFALSCFVLLISFIWQKVGGVLLVLLLAISFMVYAWASEVGYMQQAGNYLLLSFVIDLFSVVVVLKKLNNNNSEKQN